MMNYKMNCYHCQKKLSDVYFTDYVRTKHVNEVGQNVDTGAKEMYYCDYECSRKYLQHYLVKQKINFMKKAKLWAYELDWIIRSSGLCWCLVHII